MSNHKNSLLKELRLNEIYFSFTNRSSLREYINLTYLSKNQIVVNHLKRFHTELHTFFEIY